MSFYDLVQVDATTVVVPLTAVMVTAPTARYPHVAIVAGGSQGLKYEIQTLPVSATGFHIASFSSCFFSLRVWGLCPSYKWLVASYEYNFELVRQFTIIRGLLGLY